MKANEIDEARRLVELYNKLNTHIEQLSADKIHFLSSGAIDTGNTSYNLNLQIFHYWLGKDCHDSINISLTGDILACVLEQLQARRAIIKRYLTNLELNYET
jgi:hypothetical protein